MYYYDPQPARINVQSPQCESTPRRPTLAKPHGPKNRTNWGPPVLSELANSFVFNIF